MKKLKLGILLMLIGIGIPLTLIFFQEEGELFKLKIETHDKVREAEIKTLNSIVNLSKIYIKAKSLWDEVHFPAGTIVPKDIIDTWAYLELMSDEFEKALTEVQAIFIEGSIPNLKQTQDKFEISFPVEYRVGIPYKYSLGVGTIMFLIGLSFIVLWFVDKRGSMHNQIKAEKG